MTLEWVMLCITGCFCLISKTKKKNTKKIQGSAKCVIPITITLLYYITDNYLCKQGISYTNNIVIQFYSNLKPVFSFFFFFQIS